MYNRAVWVVFLWSVWEQCPGRGKTSSDVRIRVNFSPAAGLVSLRSIRACSVWPRRRKTVWQRGAWIKWHRDDDGDDGDGDDDGGEKRRKNRTAGEESVAHGDLHAARRRPPESWQIRTRASSIANSNSNSNGSGHRVHNWERRKKGGGGGGGGGKNERKVVPPTLFLSVVRVLREVRNATGTWICSVARPPRPSAELTQILPCLATTVCCRISWKPRKDTHPAVLTSSACRGTSRRSCARSSRSGCWRWATVSGPRVALEFPKNFIANGGPYRRVIVQSREYDSPCRFYDKIGCSFVRYFAGYRRRKLSKQGESIFFFFFFFESREGSRELMDTGYTRVSRWDSGRWDFDRIRNEIRYLLKTKKTFIYRLLFFFLFSFDG